MMKKTFIKCAATFALLNCVSMVDAALIDFEAYADTQNLHGVNLGGVTLTTPSARVEVYDDRFTVGYHSATKAIFNGDVLPQSNPLVGVFDAPVSMVSLWAGDDHPDADDAWELRVYSDAAGTNLVGTIADNSSPWNGNDYHQLTLSFPSILRFEAWSSTAVGYDDLEFTPVPEPGTIVIALVGLLGVAGRRIAR